MSKKIMILFAHPSQHRSEVNLPLFEASKSIAGVSVFDLYAEYPDFYIDIEREQQRLRDHDIIVFMFPLYWYSTPAILKEWQDLVLEYGFAYGHEGNALTGKRLLCAITAGGTEDAYRSSGYNHYPIRELLRPIEQTASLCGMVYLPPFALFGSRTALEEGKVGRHVERWLQTLSCLQNDRIDLDRAVQANRLEECLQITPGGQS